jgi:elongation factor P hydroxylase
MDERQYQDMGEDLMHRVDYKLNSKLIKNLAEPILMPKDKRKPF